MKQRTIELINLLEEGKTCNEICNTLGISNKQLYTYLTNLKNKGFFYNRKYYATGDITYKPLATTINSSTNNENTIITSTTQNIFKCLAISDLHFGNLLDRVDLINKVFDFCKQNDIHIIFCCGDLVDGTFTKGIQKIQRYYEQLDYFAKNYPFDKNILTFAVLGDHDYSGLLCYHQSIIELLKNYRHDIVLGNFNNSFVNIKNDKIHLFHHIDNGSMIKSNSSIILHGHAHKNSTEYKDSHLVIHVPSLSNINDSLPTILELNFEFKSGFIGNTKVKQIYFDNKPILLSEFNYDLIKGKTLSIGTIKNIENK